MVRWLSIFVALPLLVAGGLGLALGRGAPEPAAEAAESLAGALAGVSGGALEASQVEDLLASPAHFGMLGFGVVLLAVGVLKGRGRSEEEPAEYAAVADPGRPKVEKKIARKAVKSAASMAKKGHVLEAAELCFESGELEKSAQYYEQAEEWIRAAEIRHDLNAFEASAELYMKAGQHETAARIHASQEDFLRAAECYEHGESLSVAAEMYEKAGELVRAGECFARCEFHRHAAQAFLKAREYRRAAESLEAVIIEEGARVGTGQSPEADRELRKLVMQAGKLYDQAGDPASAERVLAKGGCYAAAAEMALRLDHQEQAVDWFLEAKKPERAADVLRELGDEKRAAQVLGESLRDRGDDEAAAEQLVAAGDHLSAGDLYRKLEHWSKAAECYEQDGDAVQAAEMFRSGDDLARAAENYERAGEYEAAAHCFEEVGDHDRQANALAQGRFFLEAGKLYLSQEKPDEAIHVLQQVEPGTPDAAAASALIGRLFADRGEHAVAKTKLQEAIGGAPLGRDTVEAYDALAGVHEAEGDFAAAIDILERILAFDFQFGDAEERLSRLRSKSDFRTAAPSQAQEPGEVRYRIEGELGRGGMGIVYKAQDAVLDRTVAFKVLPDSLQENAQALANFLREAKSAAKLNHPNIVTVYDAGEQEGLYYIAMEYVDGITLKQILQRRGVISPTGVLQVLLQMCEALAFAHKHKVAHRDIKTSNVMWTRDKQAKVMDFGLAKVVEEVRNHTTLVSGTPYYMSPEQTLGKNIDHRTDIYSLGVTIFELCTGTLPFREGNVPYHHVHSPPPDPREFNPKLPGLLVQIIAKCLQKDPAERFQSTEEITALVKRALAKNARPSKQA